MAETDALGSGGPGASSEGGNIKVVVRVRPFNARERDRKATCVVEMEDTQTILHPTSIDSKSRTSIARSVPDAAKTFAFDKSYWSFDDTTPHYAGQDHVFRDLGKPLLDNAFQGYNNCILAYGQTGSGKSYSMMGSSAEPGVIPRICKDMFARITDLQSDPNLTCTIEVSYLEIYNEVVRDLLNPRTKAKLRVREHPILGPYVEDLAKLAVRSFPEIQNLMDEGNKARTVAATNMNESSSRSHAVFTLTLTQKRHDVETNMDSEKVAKISLVDLAGSERANSTGAVGTRLKEGAQINKSLSTLGRVIATLADISTGDKKPSTQVPYRDSTLTWLLKDSLGGNSLTAMIAAISPADINFEETLSTLRYANSAKRIKNHAVVNEDPNARMIRELKEELAQLRSKLGTTTVGTVAGVDGESYPEHTPLDQQFVTITQPDGTSKRVSKAEIAEQLSQSEKLYQDLHQTWEQKLQMTEQVHREREAALEELGISIEKGFIGLSTPKRMPHLVNLSDDPLLAECLVYNLKPGTTTVGNADTAAQTADIRLNGTNILHHHCSFENADGLVTIITKPNAAVMVNGVRVETSKRLRTGCRVILGDFHIFRFNHPQEARAERDEQGSRLRQSVAAAEIDSPSLQRPAHNRSASSYSRPDSDTDGHRSRFDTSPIPFSAGPNESDWSLARREAISAILGADQKWTDVTDEELDSLWEDVQRQRALRRGGLRKSPDDDEASSMASFPQREKYLSGGTLDSFSIDTALTLPPTPQSEVDNDLIRAVRDEMQAQLNAEKQAYQERLQAAQTSSLAVEQIQAEKREIEQNLKTTRDEMMKRLHVQKEQFNRELRTMRETAKERLKHPSGLTERERDLARTYYEKWQRCNYVKMAATILRHAVTLKEAQVMSQHMGKTVVFQFVIIDKGHEVGSTYDLVVNDMQNHDDDLLESTPKPYVGVRVIDFRNSVVQLWSLDKLQTRLRSMRQMYQYYDRPEYIKHFQLANPFSDSCVPSYTRIGDAEIPLAAVFDCQVKELVLDVISPYTFTIVGILRTAIEPSSAEAPSSTLKFNLILHNFVGFAEREGTRVHAQMFFPDDTESSGMTTSGMVSDFEDKAVVFDSVHSLSVSLTSSRQSTLRISLFARVTSTHLDKLLSWDDMQDSAKSIESGRKRRKLRPTHDQLHDVFVRARILEMGEDGSYRPVNVVRQNRNEQGVYQLCQGLQRRLQIEVKGTSGALLPWTGVDRVRIGRLHLIDADGKVTDMRSQQVDVPLSIISTPRIQTNRDYTTNMTLLAHWDSGAHGSALLDRPTTEGYRVQMTLAWEMSSVKLTKPLELSLDIAVRMLPRSAVRSVGVFTSIFAPPPSMPKSTCSMFALSITPNTSDQRGDLWRLDSRESYVKGQESLNGWTPRGVSLIQGYIAVRRQRQLTADVERTKQFILRNRLVPVPVGDKPDARQVDLLKRVVRAWSSHRFDPVRIISRDPAVPTKRRASPRDSRPQSRDPSADALQPLATQLMATAHHMPKNPVLQRAGALLIPVPAPGNTVTTPSSPAGERGQQRWEKRLVELRAPYLHIYNPASGEETDIVNLGGARIDSEPRDLPSSNVSPATAGSGSGSVGGQGNYLRAAGAQLQMQMHLPKHVFAIYGTTRNAIFAAAGEADKTEWIFAIDTSCEGGSEESSEAE